MAEAKKGKKLSKEQWDSITVKTQKFRVAFPELFKPKAFKEGDTPKYSVIMLFPKNTDLTDLKKAIHNAAVMEWGKDKNKWPEGWRNPIRDGDKKQQWDGFAGNYFVSAGSTKPIGLVNQQREKIEDQSEIYGGCYARAVVVARVYDYMGNVGVKFYLQSVQKWADGPRFGRDAADDFDTIEDESENLENYASEESNIESEDADMGF